MRMKTTDRAFVLWGGCIALLLTVIGCNEPRVSPPPDGNDPFFVGQNEAHNGDYLATYPLHNPDSCLIRLRAEVPERLQPWACFSLWYRLPRTSPELSFRFLELYDRHYPHDTVFAFTQMMRGEFLTEMYQLDSARSVLADARRRYLELDRPLDASDADYLLARGYNQENKTAKALDSYMRVLELINSHDTTFSHRHISLYFDMAAVYGRNRDYEQQMRWLRKAQQGDSTQLDQAWKYHISIANRMSANYSQTGQFDSSLVMAHGALALFKGHVNKPYPPELLYRLGFAELKRGRCQEAIPVLREAASRQDNSPNNFTLSQIQQTLGEAYFCLSRLDSAEFFTRQGLATPDTGNLAAAYLRLGEISARKGNYQRAFEDTRQSVKLFRSFYAIERAAALSEFDVRYKTAEQEYRIRQLESRQQITRQRNLIMALALLLIIVALTGLSWRQRNRKRLLEQEKQLLQANQTLLEQEKTLAEAQAILKARELERSQQELRQTRQELHTTTRLLALKDQFIEELELRLGQQEMKDETESPGAGRSLTGIKILTEKHWLQFRERFEEHFPGFLQLLKTALPELTSAEVRLFLLLKLNFSSAEISDALGISKESVWRSRHRLSKKLGLAETGDLDDFVSGFGVRQSGNDI